MQEIAFAKINLALHVRERQADGYHRIETIFAFAEDGDTLAVSESEELALSVQGPFAGALEGDNLVLRAAEALRERFAVTQGASLLLDKRLPVASGIGGGSADAAAALRLLDRWWGLNAPRKALLEIAAGLGADVPACLASETVAGRGRGDELTPLRSDWLRGTPLLLVNPGVPVPTGPVFKRWDGVDRGGLGSGDPLEAALEGRNDLERPALEIAPEIGEVLALLREAQGVRLSRMSGSGATCFALFETIAARDEANEAIAAARPAWWRLVSRLR